MTAKGKSAGRAGGPRRWPDVMIGVLVLALLGGFGTLLVGQRKKVEATTPQTPTTTAPTAVIPASPGTVQEEPTPTPTAPKTPAASTQTTPPAAATPSATSTPQATTPAQTETPAPTPATPTTDNNTATTTEIPPVPAAPPVAPIKPPVVSQPQTQTTVPQTTPATPNTQATPAPAETPAATAPRVAPRSGGAVTTSANRTPLRSDYRISLGSFATRKTVNTQTSGVSALGYNVHPIDLGDQYVAQVGPFADEATARQALADIQRAYPGALLYRPRNQTAANTDNTSSSSNTSNSSSNAPTSAASGSSSSSSSTTTPTPPRAAAPSGPTYLQVGAFDRVESAQNLVGTLRDIDFAPTVNNPPDKKTTVLVGPYSGDALLRAESRLDKAGLDHFRVR